jgi:hypothetical protein
MLLSDQALQENRQHWHNHLLKYADDMTLVGTPEQVLQDYETLKTTFSNIHLQFAPTKTQAYIPCNFAANAEIISQQLPQCTIHRDGLTVLGVPLGTPQFITTSLSETANKYSENIHTAAGWATKQQLLKILQTSQSLFQHLLATLPIDLTETFATTIDTTNVTIFKSHFLQDIHMTEPALNHLTTRIQLPIALNGFGILSLKIRRAPSLFTSYAAIANDPTPIAQDTWKLIQNTPELLAPYIAAKTIAHQLTSTFAVPPNDNELLHHDIPQLLSDHYNSLQRQHLADSSIPQKQVFNACLAKGANTILSTWPKRPETQLDDFPFIHAIRTRLGIGLPEFFGTPCQAQAPPCHACNNNLNRKAVAEHFTSCPTTHQATHNAITTELFNCAKAAGITESTIEKVFPENGLKIDLWFRDPSPEQPLQPYYMIDPTIIQAFNPNQPVVPNTMKLLKQKCTTKRTHYAHTAFAHSATVVPLAFTSFGAYHHEFDIFLKHMTRTATSTGNHFPDIDGSFSNYWRTNILFTIARATATNAAEAARRHRVSYAARAAAD